MLSGAALIGSLAAPLPAQAAGHLVSPYPLTVSTVAGGAGGPGRATTVSIGKPCGLTSIRQTLLVGTGGIVRAIDAGTGQLRNLAGSQLGPRPSPSGIPASAVFFLQSCDVAMDQEGNLVIADSAFIVNGFSERTGDELIRVVAGSTGTFYGQPMVQGDLYTIAGNGQFGNTGDGGPATQAELGIPAGVTVDPFGNIVFATAYPTGRVRVVAESNGTFYGQAMTAGDIYTVAGGGAAGACATGAADGQLATSVQLGIATHETRSADPTQPSGLRVDGFDNIVVADPLCGERVQVIAATTGQFYGRHMTGGHIYTIAGGGRAKPANGAVAVKTRLGNPGGIALDHAGNLIISETSAQSVQVVAFTSGRFYGRQLTRGRIYTLAGGHGPAQAATAARPRRPSWTAPLRSPSTARATWRSPTLATSGSGSSPTRTARSTGSACAPATSTPSAATGSRPTRATRARRPRQRSGSARSRAIWEWRRTSRATCS